MLDGVSIWAIIGFAFAAYAVVGNDALQTLGTFINSNRRLPWQALFLFAAFVLVAVFAFGYVTDGGSLTAPGGGQGALCDFAAGCDASYGRLSNTEKYPVFEVQWYHALPPLVLLFLTRLGIPVSTTFMVLTIFATLGGLQDMLVKSLSGYGVAFLTGGLIYVVLAPTIERFFWNTRDSQHNWYWVLLQWLSTGYLWAVWLMQDFANIFVFLPRELPPGLAVGGVALTVVLLGVTFANRGGPIQKILRSKSNVTDIRSATIIDFTYACLLFWFKEVNPIPISTTWVFLGLIAGREFAVATIDKIRAPSETAKIVGMDALKAFIGLVISVGLAIGMPPVSRAIGEGDYASVALYEYGALVLAALALLGGVALARRSKDPDPDGA